nr:SAM-dependent methyltransferase [Aurantimonas sp. VKM B-3413]
MRLDRFWNTALFDRSHGYYATQDPFGRGGDFITAPEVSQIFGELIGAWMASAWQQLGHPSPFILAEIGPGRGTLMADILRTVRRVAPPCLAAAQVRLVEVSEHLAALQAAALERFDLPIKRVRRLAEIDRGPLIVVANELFDALAIRQFVFDGTDWRERCVSVSESGRFEFVLSGAISQLPDAAGRYAAMPAKAGAVLEGSPEREALAGELAARIAAEGGAGLFIDYGHALPGYGDTLQAVHGHAFADPLDRPGECDITSHVDFAMLAERFRAAGLAVSPVVEQGEFLLELGLLERAGTLGAPLDEAGRAEIRRAVQRLAGTGESEMGRLFKVVCAASRPMTLPPFGLAAAG